MWFNFLSNKIIDLMILTCVCSHHPAKVILSPLGEKKTCWQALRKNMLDFSKKKPMFPKTNGQKAQKLLVSILCYFVLP